MSTVRPIITNIITSIIRSVTGGEQLPTWTLGYNGIDAFGELDAAFSPTGANSTLEHVIFHEDGTAQQFLGPDASAFDLSVSAIGVLTFNLITNVEIDGSPATSGVTVITTGYHTVTGDFDSTADVKYLGALGGSSLFFKKQIHLTVFNDPDTTANSIHIDNRISSALQPTDFNIYNTLKPALGSDSFIPTVLDSSWTDNGGGAYTKNANVFGALGEPAPSLTVTVGTYLVFVTVTNKTGNMRIFTRNEADTGNDSYPLLEGLNELTISVPTGGLSIDDSTSLGTTVSEISFKKTNIIGTYFNGVYELLET